MTHSITSTAPTNPPGSTSYYKPPIFSLPHEIISTILTHIPDRYKNRTVKSLELALPGYTVTSKEKYGCVVLESIHSIQEIRKLWREMKNEGEWVKTFGLESWQCDPDLLNNALRCCPNIDMIMLNIGTDFGPDHLAEMFQEPRNLRRMELRFRLYVERATYLQFLSGIYFDTAIEVLSRWPACPSFTHLSLVEDPPPRQNSSHTDSSSLVTSLTDLTLDPSPILKPDDRSTNPSNSSTGLGAKSITTSSQHTFLPTKTNSNSETYTGHGPIPYLSERLAWVKPDSFAQPIVFFNFKCLSLLGSSPIASNLTHLRLRIPSRDLAPVLISQTQPVFPSLRYLDISTTNMRLGTTLIKLLKSHPFLEHLVLDRVNLFGFKAREKGAEMCAELAGCIISACVQRGKEKDQEIAAWDFAERSRIAAVEARIRAESSRRRNEEEENARLERERLLAVARSRRGHRSAAQSTFSLRDRPLRTNTISQSQSQIQVPPSDRIYIVLPPLPSMKSISIGGEAQGVATVKVKHWESSFQEEWRLGLERLLNWAIHQGERYERAMKQVREYEKIISSTKGSGNGNGKQKNKDKGKGLKPRMNVRLFRFPFPGEFDADQKNKIFAHDERNDDRVSRVENDINEIKIENKEKIELEIPLKGLIEINPIEKEYLEPYRLYLSQAQLYQSDTLQGISTKPKCVLCTVPDCEGPLRRGAEGERLDGRGGMEGKHVVGCGHEIGRKVWGWGE
ncbi:hypothetical protein TREMEDRAFT_34949 [Tremella mesenterica DSM 1558]|uniref:uncharacterized protein n=1 Tax=Tremella mesenterica (strain ATCC 24925 / CBS 8224 / DSM 1558 / NBRC 9311 / NRRL Y-6157 / RJB 2259-6 / UBC 559-6) TaxID=578456 RepID=UPI00032CC70B|nr:uncharacterized protein TREMEDRAFT_34949 [Tremella mesenterica DSM 1558]EIW66454.1 hypothetical protein TREMEDRAFT_34949 [Tremella mesenterica DSM 1558]